MVLTPATEVYAPVQVIPVRLVNPGVQKVMRDQSVKIDHHLHLQNAQQMMIVKTIMCVPMIRAKAVNV
jgi:hypothetical protein